VKVVFLPDEYPPDRLARFAPLCEIFFAASFSFALLRC
jgi:hypothetical protein